MAFVLAVIPARGGSKGLPGKNIRPLAGKPLLAYTAEAALSCKRLNEVLLSTDSEEIAAVGRALGLKVPFLRPPEFATDNAPTILALRHAVEWFEQTRGREVSAVVTLQPTTPLRCAEDVDRAVEIFLDHQPGAESLISVCKAGEKHPLTLYEAAGDYLTPFMPGVNPTTRRQEFPLIYWRNGAVYITRRDYLFETGRIVSDRPLFYEMPRSRSVGIDDLYDFALAEIFLSYKGLLGAAEGVS
jgi:CMP-N-acetylneuraminic acid synthetase